LTSVQLVPFQDSVKAILVGVEPGSSPPKAKAAVCVPAPAKAFLTEFKSFTSVQLVPFQDSVKATEGEPPKAKADVLSAPVPAN
jgi:hypothetical protein